MNLCDDDSRNGVSGQNRENDDRVQTAVAKSAPTEYVWRFTNVILSGNA